MCHNCSGSTANIHDVSKHLFQDAIGLFEKFAVFSLNKSDIHDLDDTLLSDINTCI